MESPHQAQTNSDVLSHDAHCSGAIEYARDEAARKERRREYERQWRKDNPDKRAAARQKYRANNRDKIDEFNRQRREQRAAERQASGATPKIKFANGAERQEYMRDWFRGWHLNRKYGLSLSEVDAMLVAQGGVCAVCRRPDEGARGWCIDHCHSSGRVRGVLCHPCNTAIGFMRDEPETLRAAASYLEAPR